VRFGADVNDVIGEQSESMPVSVLIGVAGRDVGARSESNEESLNGPFHLAQENVISGYGDSVRLESVDSDERESNSLNVNIMALLPIVLLARLRWQLKPYHFLYDLSIITLSPLAKVVCGVITLSRGTRLYLKADCLRSDPTDI
jgi:hypothetical protein